jgi:hypothetical protein
MVRQPTEALHRNLVHSFVAERAPRWSHGLVVVTREPCESIPCGRTTVFAMA